jgi:predicted dehydrogenase
VVFSVAIVGLGAVGQLYDVGGPPGNIRSHAKAVSLNSSLRLCLGIDTDQSRRAQFTATYGAAALSDLPKGLEDFGPDVVIVSTPTHTHLSVIQEILRHARPTLILCEKPLSGTADDAEKIRVACEQARVPVFVNYIRRSTPGAKLIKESILSGRIGTDIHCVGWYSDGLLHSGIHLLDLMEFMRGDAVSLDLTEPFSDVGRDPESPCVQVNFGSGQGLLIGRGATRMPFFVLDLVGSGGAASFGRQDGDSAELMIGNNNSRVGLSGGVRPAYSRVVAGLSEYQAHVTADLVGQLETGSSVLTTGDRGAAHVRLIEEAMGEQCE